MVVVVVVVVVVVMVVVVVCTHVSKGDNLVALICFLSSQKANKPRETTKRWGSQACKISHDTSLLITLMFIATNHAHVYHNQLCTCSSQLTHIHDY